MVASAADFGAEVTERAGSSALGASRCVLVRATGGCGPSVRAHARFVSLHAIAPEANSRTYLLATACVTSALIGLD